MRACGNERSPRILLQTLICADESLAQAMTMREFTEKTDMWAWGVFVWELTTRCELPYAEIESAVELVKQIGRGVRLRRAHSVSADVWALMSSCWEARAAARPTFAEVVALLGDADAHGGDVLQVRAVRVSLDAQRAPLTLAACMQEGLGAATVYAALSEANVTYAVPMVRPWEVVWLDV